MLINSGASFKGNSGTLIYKVNRPVKVERAKYFRRLAVNMNIRECEFEGGEK